MELGKVRPKLLPKAYEVVPDRVAPALAFQRSTERYGLFERQFDVVSPEESERENRVVRAPAASRSLLKDGACGSPETLDVALHPLRLSEHPPNLRVQVVAARTEGNPMDVGPVEGTRTVGHQVAWSSDVECSATPDSPAWCVGGALGVEISVEVTQGHVHAPPVVREGSPQAVPVTNGMPQLRLTVVTVGRERIASMKLR